MNKREKMIYDILFGFLFVTTIYNTVEVAKISRAQNIIERENQRKEFAKYALEHMKYMETDEYKMEQANRPKTFIDSILIELHKITSNEDDN